MAPSSRHPYPLWLRPSSAVVAGGTPDRQLDGAWKLWERLRDLDRRYATFVDVVLASALFLLSSGWPVDAGRNPPDLWLVAGLTFPLIFRRRAPMAVFLTISAVALVQWLLTGPALADAALLVAVYTVALESAWPFVVAAAVILETGVVMATVRWTPTGSDFKSFVFLTGLAFAALLAGVVVRALRSQLDWLAERTERLELERDQQASLAAAAERARIAREMHDVVSHNIQVMVTLADAASAAQAVQPTRAAEAMHEVSSTGRQALNDMRRMLGVLRDEPVATGNGSAQPLLAPQPGLGDLAALVERVRGTGLQVTVAQSGRPFEVSGAAGLTAYRIVQEALTNALKHANDPSAVEVQLAFDDPDIAVRITDDGHRDAPVPVTGNGGGTVRGGRPGAGAGGHGVTGMAERAAAFGGTLRAGPRETGGWEVAALLRDCKAPTPA
jgi:signal transduction histidine kinase